MDPQTPVMNADELRALQAPLKETYRNHPGAALVTLRAQARPGEGISCRVQTGRALVEAGLHPASGGTGELACSGDLLLEALAACAGVTLQAVSTALGLPLAGGTVRAEGELDFRGTLGVDKDAVVCFRSIRLEFELEGSLTAEQLASLRRLTERYCVVYQTLAKGVPVRVGFRVS